MKKFWAAVVVIAIAAGIYFLAGKNSAPENSTVPPISFSQNNSNAIAPPPENSPCVAANPSATSVAVSPTETASRGTLVPATTADTNAAQNLSPRMILDNARVAIRSYQDRFGENPVGENAEITAALMGKNPKQVNFIAPESGLRVNENGELIDAYGTPFFFHQLSGKEMEIRSAGEDKKMWTFDDLITR